jgi:glucan 1,3-beta-glucosidase
MGKKSWTQNYSRFTWSAWFPSRFLLMILFPPGTNEQFPKNGFDNSGQRTSNPSWHKDNNNVARSLEVVKTMASWYANQTDVVSAIQSLNEPAGYLGGNFLDVLSQYWYDSYGNTRYPYGTDRQGNAVQVLHDAFQPLDYWRGKFEGFDGVMMDTHYYGVFSHENLVRSRDQQIAAACDQAAGIRNFDLWTVVGEWSVAITDCASKVYGPNGGSRYDGTYAGSSYIGSCDPYTQSGAHYSEDYKEFMRKFYEAQTSCE